jgi:hypothetical protein
MKHAFSFCFLKISDGLSHVTLLLAKRALDHCLPDELVPAVPAQCVLALEGPRDAGVAANEALLFGHDCVSGSVRGDFATGF